jgi:hypothetical protein
MTNTTNDKLFAATNPYRLVNLRARMARAIAARLKAEAEAKADREASYDRQARS